MELDRAAHGQRKELRTPGVRELAERSNRRRFSFCVYRAWWLPST